MRHWLKEWLIQQGFPSDKIHAVGGGSNVDMIGVRISVQVQYRSIVPF